MLLQLANGMQEAGRTKTDAKGNFTFKLEDSGNPHLIRVIHEGVTYHQMAPPGTPAVDVEVYDVTPKVTGLSVTADVMRLQAQGNELQGIRLFAINNSSSPPRTQMNDHNFEFYLPEGAVIDQGMAKTQGGQPVNSAPVPQKEKNQYAFIFPLRPGETQFQVGFHLPYSGSASIEPKPLYPAQHFVVMLPKTMQFSAQPTSGFQSMQDPQNRDVTVQVASNTALGQPLGFQISGTGVIPENGTQGGGESGGAMAGGDNRPGGGLGPPTDAPDPLDKYRWYILGGFGALLVAGGIYITMRSKTATVPEFAPAAAVLTSAPAPAAPVAASAATPSHGLLDALKEELFQLELDHTRGKISQPEYESAKAALDRTLSRALKRESVKVT